MTADEFESFVSEYATSVNVNRTSNDAVLLEMQDIGSGVVHHDSQIRSVANQFDGSVEHIAVGSWLVTFE
jgi:hypothetical protein